MKNSDHFTAPTEPWKSPQLEISNVTSDSLDVSLERSQDQYDVSQCNGKSIMTGVMEGFQEENDAILDNREDDNDVDDDDENYMSLPASTHTLLVTETLLSVSFLFAVGIACLSLACLLLVLLNELSKGQKGNVLSIPGGVGAGVRGAQFCGIFVGVLMEEEIGQGLILLRSISRGSFQHSYPHLSYTRFVLCNILRILFGYLFLLNLFITIVQADDVITIFFDVLALEFVQKLDDVAFDVAKKDLLGKQLCDATSVDYKMMRVEAWHEIKATVKAKEDRYSIHAKTRKRGFRHLLKAVYFINLAGLLTGVIFIGEKQNRGYYRCNSVNVNFGDNVWENAVVLNGTNGSYQTTLVYSYFNGIYEVEGNHDGYPRFVERNKVDGSAFENVIGAEIKYCKKEEAWVFMHQDIGKRGDTADSDCSWLLRSPDTAEYNLVDVDREDWSVWTGIILQGNEVSITCNECEKEADCNYHGACVNGKCECYPDEQYFGQHCEFENPCEVLIDDDDEFWNISKNSYGTVLMSYLRPMYEWKATHDLLAGIINSVIADEIGGLSSPAMTSNSSNASRTNSNLNESNITDTDDDLGTIQDFVANFTSLESSKGNYATVTTLFSGSRWFSAVDFIENGTSTIHKKDYHAFWDQLFEQRTLFISDPATGATPVGVDFYEIVNDAKYDDYGPFGLLKPGANITGQGYFHCYNPDL